jgi:hypothetical protein
MQLVIFILICSIIILIIGASIENVNNPFFNLYLGNNKDQCNHINKHQYVRLLDIFILGPVGLFIGYNIYDKQFDNLNSLLGLCVILYGFSTITFNGLNYLNNLNNN